MTGEKRKQIPAFEELSETALVRVTGGAPGPRSASAWLGPERSHPASAAQTFSVDQDLDRPDMAVIQPK